MTTEIAEYSVTEAALRELSEKYSGVVFEVTTTKGMTVAKEARAELRGLRTALEKKRVEIKAPALDHCRLIDAEAKRITAELVSLEEPIDVTIKAEESRKEVEKLAKLQAEQERQDAIAAKIDAIRNVPASLTGKPSVIIAGQLTKLEAETLDSDEFAEHFQSASDALELTVSRVRQMYTDQLAHEAEQKQIAADRAELERVKAENAKLQHDADERAAAERDRLAAEAAAERAEIHRLAQAERDRVAEEERKAAAIERGKQQAAAAAERDRLAAERREIEAQQQAERDRLAAQQALLAKEAAALAKEKAAAAKKAEAERLAGLGLREAAQAVVDYCADGITVSPMLYQLVQDLGAALSNDAVQAKPARAKRSAAA